LSTHTKRLKDRQLPILLLLLSFKVQAYPTPPTGHFARHVHTLAALISGIVGGKSTQLPHIATKVPDGSTILVMIS
jgi:hypothetical protein